MSVTDRPVSDLPYGFDWGYVTGRIIHALADTISDPDKEPEARGASGRVVFVPKPKPSSVNGVLVVYERTVVQLNDEGYLVDAHGDQLPVALLSGDYAVTFELTGGQLGGFQIRVTPEHTAANPLDLATAAPYEPPTGVAVTTMRVPMNPTEGYALGWLNGELAWLSGGGGGAVSGIELVSGTVTLGSSGTPIREFYTTGTAIIGGVSFPAGTAIVFRRTIGGQWGYIVVDGWTATGSIPDPELITVTATAPNWTDDAINGGGTWTTPTIAGVTYSPASGTATLGQTVTVIAIAQTGYQLNGTSSWTHTFPAASTPPPTHTLAVNHTADGATQAGTDSLTWPGMDIGTPSATRRVVVILSAYRSSGTNLTDVNSSIAMTIGGIPATRDVIGFSAGGSSRMVTMFSAVATTGTTADIAFTYTGVVSNSNISVYAIDGGTSAFVDGERAYNNNTNNGVSLTVPTTAGSASIFAAYSVAADQTFTWTGAIAGPTTSGKTPALTITSASRQGTSNATHTASVTCSGINITGAGGTWRPA